MGGNNTVIINSKIKNNIQYEFFILNRCYLKISLYYVNERQLLTEIISLDLHLVNSFPYNSDFKKKYNDRSRGWANVEILEIIYHSR